MKHPQIILVTGASSGFEESLLRSWQHKDISFMAPVGKQYPIIPASKCCNWILLILHQYPMPYRQF